jgi:hypothetical protein
MYTALESKEAGEGRLGRGTRVMKKVKETCYR